MGSTWPASEVQDVGKAIYEPFLPPLRPSLTLSTASLQAPSLIHVEYPGLVVNPDKALRTLGGTAKLSNTFNDPKRKLELRFRPGDVYSNPVTGDGSATCGILIKVRRRKRPPEAAESEPVPKPGPVDLMGPDLSDPIQMSAEERRVFLETERLPSRFIRTTATGEEFEVIKGAENIVDDDGDWAQRNKVPFPENQQDGPSSRLATLPDGSVLSRDMILADEEALLERLDQQDIERTCDGPVARTGMDKQRVYIQIPQKSSPLPNSEFTVTALGLVHREYKFNGLCDYQYLPTTKNKYGQQESIRKKIMPLFANPDSDNTKKNLILDNFKSGRGRRNKIPSFLVPAVMSRLDKPMPDLAECFMDDPVNVNEPVVPSPQNSIQSSRPRRIVYSHMCNFRVTDDEVKNPKAKMLVPETALKEALMEAEKRGLLGRQFKQIQTAFVERPIWTKQSLEFDTKMAKYELKYILPCVAYFALNGPWRGCWIRLGYDPRTHRPAFRYQILDYRVPAAYRVFLPNKDTETDVQSFGRITFSFQPGDIPPKSQMFYQFCEVHIPQVEALTLAITSRLDKDTRVPFDPALGFLDEDMAEFCRLSISRFIEIRLMETGKIATVTLPDLALLPGGQVPPRPVPKGPIGRSFHRLRSGKSPNLVMPSDGTEPQDEDSLMADLSIDPDQSQNADDEADSDEEDIADEDDPILQEILRITREEAEMIDKNQSP